MGKKKSSGKRSVVIKRVCLIKIKKGPKKGQCAKKGYEVGNKRFRLKHLAIRQKNINKRKNQGKKR